MSSARKRQRYVRNVLENLEGAFGNEDTDFEQSSSASSEQAIQQVSPVFGDDEEGVASVDEFEDGGGSAASSDEFEGGDESDGWSRISEDESDESNVSEMIFGDFDGHPASPSVDLSLKEELVLWVVENQIPHSKVDSLLHILSRKFPNENLPRSCRSLLQTPRTVDLIQMGGGFYYHFGLKNGISEQLAKWNKAIDSFDIYVNIDGLPLTKSTGSQFWPILARMRRDDLGDSKVFCVGCFWGYEKPFDSNIFLTTFVDELDQVLTQGVPFLGQTVHINKIGFICDAPAKSFVKKTVDHGGYSSCHKCVVNGNYVVSSRAIRTQRTPRGCVVYSDLTAPLRDDESFRSQSDGRHHKGTSELERLQIDMVKDFPSDFLHLGVLGVSKKLIIMWTTPSEFKLSPLRIRRLDSNLLSFKQFCPREFPRKTRTTKDAPRWKGTEHYGFFMYTGIAALHNILPENLYIQFLMFSIGMRILCSEDYCKDSEMIKYAAELLKKFVIASVQSYGESFLVYNVHGLIHLADDVMRYGPLHHFSAFSFESYLYDIKRKVRKSDKPLQQLVKRYKEITNNVVRNPIVCNTEWYNFKNEHFDGPVPPNFDGIQYRKVWVGGRFLARETVEDQANCCVLLQGKKVVLIQNFVKILGEPYIVGKEYVNPANFFTVPLESSLLDILQISTLNDEAQIWPLNFVLKKFFRMPIPELPNSFVVVPFANENLKFN